MTAKELMTPRFEVVGEYPNSEINKGDIMEAVDGTIGGYSTKEYMPLPNKSIFVIEFEKYPHLFRKLNWWEFREQEDMPKKVICKAIENDTEILRIQEWDMDMLVGWTNKERRECASLLSWKPEHGYFPVD